MPAEGGDVSHVELHAILGVSCLLGRCAVQRWVVVWSLRLRHGPLDLSRCDKGGGLYSPNLHYLACELGRQEREHCWMAAVISNPHQVSVDQDGEVVAAVMGGSSMADVGYGDVLCTGSGEPVQGSGNGKGAMRVERSFVLGQDSIVGDGPIDVGHQDSFVVAQELSQSLIGPVVHQLLPSDFIQEFIWVVHNERKLDMVS